MATLQELIVQKNALEKQIAEATAHGRTEAIAQVRALMAENALTLTDLGGRSTSSNGRPAKSAKTKPGTGTKVAAKYRNASTGESWSGRGLQPRWLKAALASGRKMADFAV